MGLRAKPPMGRPSPSSRGYAIHVGVNRVDPLSYGNWSGELQRCVEDATRMRELTSAAGCAVGAVLADQDATTKRVLDELTTAARHCQPGDLLVLTFSGHGGQLVDDNADEADGRDETWVLYDRMLLDDELRLALTAFAAGVRILVIADCCHSGTDDELQLNPSLRVKTIPPEPQATNVQGNGDVYDSIHRIGQYVAPRASLVLLFACGDEEIAAEDDGGGLLTQKLVNVWDGGAFAGDHNTFRNAIAAMVTMALIGTGFRQTPGLLPAAGNDLGTFLAQRPFTVAPPGPLPATPTLATVTNGDSSISAPGASPRAVTVTVRVELDP